MAEAEPMPKMFIAVEREDGWSDWIAPQMKDYKLVCCDCGLVHRINFHVRQVVKHKKNGVFTHKEPKGEMAVFFQAARDDRSTGQKRRNKKHRNWKSK